MGDHTMSAAAPSFRAAIALCAALPALACDAEGSALLMVDVRTDYVPGVEFTRVRNTVEAFAWRPVDTEARFGQDFIAGVRAAEIDLLDETGTHLLVTDLVAADGRVVASRRTRMQVSGAIVVTVILARGGDVACGTDADCAVTASCAEGHCSDGTCLSAPRAGACDETMYCSIDDGDCRPLPGGVFPDEDAGPGGGPLPGDDAGPEIDAGAAGGCGTAADCAVGEVCAGGACVVPSAFRVTQATLRDPHLFAEAGRGFCICSDGTSYVNDMAADEIQSLAHNIVFVFTPLDAGAGTNRVEAHEDANCASAGECRPAAPPVVGSAVHTVAGDTACFAADRSNLTSSYGAPNSPSPPCAVSDPLALTIDFAGAELALTDVRIAARFSGDRLVDGVLEGFLSTSAARAAVLGSHDQLCGGTLRVYDLLKGGDACESGDDSDGGGWFLYWNFVAERVDWSE